MIVFKHHIVHRIKDSERISAMALEFANDASKRIVNFSNTLHMDSPLVMEPLATLAIHQAQLLAHANTHMEHAYAEFESVLEDLPTCWSEQSRAALELERILWHAQACIAEPYGPDMLQLYGLSEAPPAGFRALATYAHNTITLLGAQPATLKGEFGADLKTSQIASAIALPLGALDDFLFSLDSATLEIKSALAARDAAADNWMRTWRGTCTILEGLFLLAGREELAASVRPLLPRIIDEPQHTFSNINAHDIEKTSSL